MKPLAIPHGGRFFVCGGGNRDARSLLGNRQFGRARSSAVRLGATVGGRVGQDQLVITDPPHTG